MATTEFEKINQKIYDLSMVICRYIQNNNTPSWYSFSTPCTRILAKMENLEREIRTSLQKYPDPKIESALRNVRECRLRFKKYTLPLEQKQIAMERQACFEKMFCFWKKWDRNTVKQFCKHNAFKLILNVGLVALIYYAPRNL